MLTKSDIDSFVNAKKKYDESYALVRDLGYRIGAHGSAPVFNRIDTFMDAARLCNASIRPMAGGFCFVYRDEWFFYSREADESAEEVA